MKQAHFDDAAEKHKDSQGEARNARVRTCGLFKESFPRHGGKATNKLT